MEGSACNIDCKIVVTWLSFTTFAEMLQTLFVHPTEHYDFLVRLEHAALSRYHHNVAADASAIFGKSGKYANNRLAVASGESAGPLRPGFDPAQLLFDDLKVRHDRTYLKRRSMLIL